MMRITFLALLGCMVAAVSFAENPNSATCEAKECERIAQSIIGRLNKTVNPCDNFYDYVCGWNEKDERMSYFYNYLNMETYKEVANLLDKTLRDPSKPEDNLLLSVEKEWFSSCMINGTIDVLKLEKLVTTPDEMKSLYEKVVMSNSEIMDEKNRSQFCTKTLPFKNSGATIQLAQTYFLDYTNHTISDILGGIAKEIKSLVVDSISMNDETKNRLVKRLRAARWAPKNNMHYFIPLEFRKVEDKLDTEVDFDKNSVYYSPIYHLDKNVVGLTLFELHVPTFYSEAPLAFTYGTTGFKLASIINSDFGIINELFQNATEQNPRIKEYEEKIKRIADALHITENIEYEELKIRFLQKMVGIEVALKAYHSARNTILPEQKLPKLDNLSADELFFIAFARVNCVSRIKGKNAEKHPKAYYEVNEIVRGMEEFSAAFKCGSDWYFNKIDKSD